MLKFNGISINIGISLGVVYKWYIVGVEYGWDYNIDSCGISVSSCLPCSSLLRVFACIPLAVTGLIVVYSFFPTGTVEQSMIDRDRERRSDSPSGSINLLCTDAWLFREGSWFHQGTFLYDRNDHTGQSISRLFYTGRPEPGPVTAWIPTYQKEFAGYLEKRDNMNNPPFLSMVLDRSRNGQHDFRGAGFIMSNSEFERIGRTTFVYSGSRHLVPFVPRLGVNNPAQDNSHVYIRSFAPYAEVYVESS